MKERSGNREIKAATENIRHHRNEFAPLFCQCFDIENSAENLIASSRLTRFRYFAFRRNWRNERVGWDFIAMSRFDRLPISRVLAKRDNLDLGLCHDR